MRRRSKPCDVRSADARTKLDADALSCLRVQSVCHTTTLATIRKPRALKRCLARHHRTAEPAQIGAIMRRWRASIAASTNTPSHATTRRKRLTLPLRRLAGSCGIILRLALADTQEGHYEAGLENFEQALKLVGDHPRLTFSARFTRTWPVRAVSQRPQKVRYLRKPSATTAHGHKANAALGYNTWHNLMLVASVARAGCVGTLALSPRILPSAARKCRLFVDSIGELRTLRGDLDEAQQVLERAVALALKTATRWYAGQPAHARVAVIYR